MRLLSKISKDYHMIKQIDLVQKQKKQEPTKFIMIIITTNDGTNFYARVHKHHGCLHVTKCITTSQKKENEKHT